MNDSLIAYLKARPEDFVISWYCDGLTKRRPFSLGWVDVWFEDQLAWTILAPWDDEPSPDDIIAAPDYAGVYLQDGATGRDVGAALFRLGAQFEDSDIAETAEIQAGVKDPVWTGTCAWSAQEINRQIEAWCLQHIGRPLQAACDYDHGLSPLHQRAVDALARIEDGTEQLYTLRAGANEGGEGVTVRATGDVMEMFLQELIEEDSE